jgi:hypothetical protein
MMIVACGAEMRHPFAVAVVSGRQMTPTKTKRV